MTEKRLPKLFIGSSIEGLEIANAIQEILEYDAETVVWTQGVFKPGQVTLLQLARLAPTFDFSLFVFTPDDISDIRGIRHRVARDNVIFELGLFFGALGLDRCLYLVPRGIADLHLPTDLLGISPLDYNPKRADGRLLAALGPACNKIRHIMRQPEVMGGGNRTAHKYTGADKRIPPHYAFLSLGDYVHLWNSKDMLVARAQVRESFTDTYGDEFELLRPQFNKIWLFLESLSDAVLTGSIDEKGAKRTFRETVLSFWPWVTHSITPFSSDVDDVWDELPQLGVLHQLWKNKV